MRRSTAGVNPRLFPELSIRRHPSPARPVRDPLISILARTRFPHDRRGFPDWHERDIPASCARMDPTPGTDPTAAQRRGDGDETGAAAGGPAPPRWQRGFHERLVGGIILLTLILIALGTWFYLNPGDHLQSPELQPVLRVTREGEIPVGGSRVVTWGSRTILVVRHAEHEYAAVSGTSPIDGCILRWDAASLRVVSPCSFVVFGLDGNVVRGNTTVPLHRYSVFVRHGTIYVTGA